MSTPDAHPNARWRGNPAWPAEHTGSAASGAMAESARPCEEQLPVLEPQAALSALPTPPDKPSPVNLFGVPAGEVVDPRFDLKRLRRVRCTEEPPETTP
ncbi:hypothetical protein AB0I98_27720 [Streptomyces sp. NPDC050211]|uniref:hypothetical protein n=1 Tax=Streptomyces sp. NPDC050211 TaxID=3154932 RepID=UPI00342D8EC1